jgi:hypothetical protein
MISPMQRSQWKILGYATALGLVAAAAYVVEKQAAVEAAGPTAPRLEVDPFWPKPLPNHWVMGAVIGLGVDSKDNVWIVHRQGSLEDKEKYATWNPKAAECCAPAPPVLAFSPDGTLIAHWGGNGNGFDWPSSNHGIDVDHKGNVWIGGNGRGSVPAALAHDESKMSAAGAVHDSFLLKFTQAGQFLMQIGKPFASKGSNDVTNLRLPAKSLVDPKTFTSPMATATAASLSSTPTPASTSATGAPTAASRTTPTSGPTIPTLQRPSSSGPPSTA